MASTKTTKTKSNDVVEAQVSEDRTEIINKTEAKASKKTKNKGASAKKTVPVGRQKQRKGDSENEDKKAPTKISPNDRKPASKGQTKEEQEKKNADFNKQRVVWFDQYMKGIMPNLYDMHINPSREHLLTNDEQIRLAEFIQAGIAAKMLSNYVAESLGEEGPHLQKTIEKYRDDVVEMLDQAGYPSKMFEDKKMRRKLNRLVSQGEEARNIFAEKNLGLVTMIAGRRKKISNTAGSVDIDDLIAEGMNGLMIAIDHYNPATGFKFSTPAAWWIEQPIRNYLDSKTKTIHMPTHMNNIYRSIYYAERALRDQYPDDSEITYEKIAEYCQSTGRDITVEKIEDAMKHRRETISYDAPFNENDSNEKSLVELMESDVDVSNDVLEDLGGKDNFNRMLALVEDDKRREILRDWYSSTGMHDLVILSNVSRKHCLTKERVRALKNDGEKELFGKISDMAKEKGVSIADAIMVNDEELEFNSRHELY